jgi:hypothetical protein
MHIYISLDSQQGKGVPTHTSNPIRMHMDRCTHDQQYEYP